MAARSSQFMNKYNPTGAEPVPGALACLTLLSQESISPPTLRADALLIYAAANGTYLPSNDDVKFNGNLSIPFEAGKTYRIRVLKFVFSVFRSCAGAHSISAFHSIGIFATTFFWIDGHDMRVIEADGVSSALPLKATSPRMKC